MRSNSSELALGAEDRLSGVEQASWLALLEVEFDNIEPRSIGCLPRIESRTRRMISALSRFWRARGHVTDARRWLSRGLSQDAHLSADVRADVRADACGRLPAKLLERLGSCNGFPRGGLAAFPRWP